MDADSSFVVAQVIPPLCVSSSSVQEGAFISFWADSCGLVILGTVNVRAVVKCTIPAADRSATTLVDKVPVEASVGPVLSALVLHEERALLRAELLQVSVVLRLLGLRLQRAGGVGGPGRGGAARQRALGHRLPPPPPPLPPRSPLLFTLRGPHGGSPAQAPPPPLPPRRRGAGWEL